MNKLTIANKQGQVGVGVGRFYTNVSYRYKRGKSGRVIIRRKGKAKIMVCKAWGSMSQVDATDFLSEDNS